MVFKNNKNKKKKTIAKYTSVLFIGGAHVASPEGASAGGSVISPPDITAARREIKWNLEDQ